MIVFHASTVHIEEFYIPYGGLHVGGYQSAIECALRKLYEGRGKGHYIDHIHIHQCELISTNPYESFDEGSDEGWRKLHNVLLRDNVIFDSIKYINEYEPDIMPSFCLFDTTNIKILDHSTMHMDIAEDILNGQFTFEGYQGHYY